MKLILLLFVSITSLNVHAVELPTEHQPQGNLVGVTIKVYKLKSVPYKFTDDLQPVKIITKNYNRQNLLSHYKETIDITGGADIGDVKDSSYYRTIRNYPIEYDKDGYQLPSNNESREYDERGRLLSITTSDDFGGSSKRVYSYYDDRITVETFQVKNETLLSSDMEQPKETWLLDETGRIHSIEYHCENCITINFEYNDKNLVTKEVITRNGELDSFTEYHYEDFDSEENWTARFEVSSSETSNDKRVLLSVREIQYR